MTTLRRWHLLLLLPLLAAPALAACGEHEDDEAAEAGETAEAPGAVAESAAALQREATVAETDARATALAAVPGGAVKDFELEREDGALIYSYDISVAGKTGIDEVHVDAMTGKVLSNTHETPEDETAEAAEDSAKGT